MTAVTAVPSHDRAPLLESTRVLLAVHGGEPEGWGREMRRTVALWANPSVRILAVLAVPCPPFTSLIPPAARMYRAARAAWRAAEEKRVQRAIDEITPALPRDPDIVWATVSYADPGRTIAEHARAWAADVLLMAVTPAAGLWLGAVHDRVIRRAGCPVLLTPAPDARRGA
jgi:nucleotide-binding universal stress UspA family protein